MSILGFHICQSEVDDVQGQNPTRMLNSTTANNMKRTSMYDGSFDNFIDGTFMLFDCVAKSNSDSERSYVNLFVLVIHVIFILEFNDDQDSVTLQFPLKLEMSNYTEVVAINQTEYNAILNACVHQQKLLWSSGHFDSESFPLQSLTYNFKFRTNVEVLWITSSNKNYMYTM
jgi:hypothetical protein